jgi:hypothetical protein
MGAKPNPYLNNPVVDFVRDLLPSMVVEADARQEPGISGQSYHIDLPPATGNDYCFTLWLGSGEKQIAARLLNADKSSYFWYRPFEDAEFRSAERLDKAFREAVEVIMRHNTRIEQKRGLLFNHFKLNTNLQAPPSGLSHPWHIVVGKYLGITSRLTVSRGTTKYRCRAVIPRRRLNPL